MHETEDSQLFVANMQAEFGVGARCTSLGPETTTGSKIASNVIDQDGIGRSSQGTTHGSTNQLADAVAPTNGTVQESASEPTLTAAVAFDAREHQPATNMDEPSSDPLWQRDRTTILNQAVSQAASRPKEQPLAAPADGSAVSSHKMEISQQTPTQVNVDRDYSGFYDAMPDSAPIDMDTAADQHRGTDATVSQINDRTLHDDDTGAVNFGNLSDLGRPSSQVSEDAGFEATEGDWRNQDTSQLMSNRGYTPYKQNGLLPETPAVPKNPFAAKSGIAPPIAGSQLFGQTQFSSAMKKASPTSSRPSPNLFLNSISPNIYETSPLKDRTNVSSPTDIRTSSPQRHLEIPGTTARAKDSGLERILEETPSVSRSQKQDLVPESPATSPTRPRSADREPLTHYESMKKSQERKLSGEIVESEYVVDDSEPDDVIRKIERRKRIERRKAQAAEEMERVSFTPFGRRSFDEQSSRKKRRISNEDDENVSGVHMAKHAAPANFDTGAVVRDSQKRPSASTETGPTGSNTASPGVKPAKGHNISNEDQTDMMEDVRATEEDMIPATSPVASAAVSDRNDFQPASEPELPRLPEADTAPLATATDSREPSSMPPIQRRTRKRYGAKRVVRNPFLSSSLSEDKSHSPAPQKQDVQDDTVAETTPQSTPPQFADSAPATVTAPRHVDCESNPLTPRQPHAAAVVTGTSSSLSVLSTTPVQSSKTTPGTQHSPASARTPSAKTTGLRNGYDHLGSRSHVSASSESPRMTRRAVRMSRRAPLLESDSADEYRRSPSASAMEQSIAPGKASSRTSRHSLASHQKGGCLFGGMAFAISLRSNGGDKQNERAKLENHITNAGGQILEDGFRELFEQSTVLNTAQPVFDQGNVLKLTRVGLDSGFTALIADGHSRKAKYMQALALGLPCLAQQWVQTCLRKGTLVDWGPYLLCAGSSAVLGNVIRSRCLVPYPAADAYLSGIIDQRPRLLDGHSILVVVDGRKSRSEAKQPYIFLAQALGPSVSRVLTIQQARDALRERDEAGQPFDWIYVDSGTGSVDAVFAAAPPPPQAKKRRRSAPAPAAPLSPSTRVLNDELVIQSLILGRMVEEEEICF